MKKQKMGSDSDDFPAQAGMLEEVAAVALKRVIAWQIEQEMAAQKRTKTAMASWTVRSRDLSRRLLDEPGPIPMSGTETISVKPCRHGPTDR